MSRRRRRWWPRRDAEYYARRALEAHAAGRYADSEAAFHHLVDHGPRGLLTGLGLWTGVIGTAVIRPGRPGGLVVFSPIDASTGNPGDPDGAPPEVMWAGRFVACALNDDMDTAEALFNTAVEYPSELTKGMMVVLALASQVVRQHAAGH